MRRLMRQMGLVPIHQKPRTSVPHPEHSMYTYLLSDLAIEQSSQIWCADVTSTPMRRRFLCLVCIMDRASRTILAWQLSNSLDAEFCVATREEVLALYGHPAIFTDQGSQFTSLGFTELLEASGAHIPMDERGR